MAIWKRVFSLCYAMFFIGHITFTVIARKSLENTERVLTSKISEMELEYLALNSMVNLNLAHELGYRDAQVNTYFADTKGRANTVGFNNHE
jgi:hypothetical protein